MTKIWPHTPGPWHVVPEAEAMHRWVIAHSDGDSIADCAPAGPWIAPKEADANACLIAAAPDMLAALRMTIADIEMNSIHGVARMTIERIRAAIAKAELVE